MESYKIVCDYQSINEGASVISVQYYPSPDRQLDTNGDRNTVHALWEGHRQVIKSLMQSV